MHACIPVHSELNECKKKIAIDRQKFEMFSSQCFTVVETKSVAKIA